MPERHRERPPRTAGAAAGRTAGAGRRRAPPPLRASVLASRQRFEEGVERAAVEDAGEPEDEEGRGDVGEAELEQRDQARPAGRERARRSRRASAAWPAATRRVAIMKSERAGRRQDRAAAIAPTNGIRPSSRTTNRHGREQRGEAERLAHEDLEAPSAPRRCPGRGSAPAAASWRPPRRCRADARAPRAAAARTRSKWLGSCAVRTTASRGRCRSQSAREPEAERARRASAPAAGAPRRSRAGARAS